MARFALQAEIWDRLPDPPGCTPSTPPSYDYHYRWFNDAELADVLAQIERKPGRNVRVTRIEWLHTATHGPLGSVMDADSPNRMVNDLGDVFFPRQPGRRRMV